MELVNVNISVFERVQYARKILEPMIQGKTNNEIKIMLCHCINKKIGRNYELTKEEDKFYHFILENNLSPKTLYKYFLVFDYPKHIQTQLRNKEIGMRKAQELAHAHRTMASRKGKKEIMEQMLIIIRGLKWRDLDRISKM